MPEEHESTPKNQNLKIYSLNEINHDIVKQHGLLGIGLVLGGRFIGNIWSKQAGGQGAKVGNWLASVCRLGAVHGVEAAITYGTSFTLGVLGLLTAVLGIHGYAHSAKMRKDDERESERYSDYRREFPPGTEGAGPEVERSGDDSSIPVTDAENLHG